MKDISVYNENGLVSVIRHLRMVRSYFDYELAREEERLMILLEAAKEFQAPVDAHGKRFSPDTKKKQYPLTRLPAHIAQAFRSGEMVQSEGMG